MKKCAKINLCIIGSTNFGKSSIAASLIHVAATTDGGIHLLGSPTQVLKMADDLKANGQHVATGWDDIAKFKFLLNGSDGRSWQISLRDYPGALFAKYVEHPTLMSRMKGLFAGQTTSSHDEYTFDKTAEKKAIQLIAELERADALIVLVPADVSDAKYGNDRAIYKQKLPEFIEAVMRHRPNIPVCLCINKWDMFDCGIENLEDKLNEYPFCDFYRSLQLVCGDNLSIAAVSAFGHHDPNDREKIDPNQEQKPLNILETLLPLAEKAEKARFERTVEAWKQSNWIKKTLVFPFRTVSLLAARYTDKHIRNGLLKMAAKAWVFFGIFAIATTALFASVVTGLLCWKETTGFANIESRFAEYRKAPYSVDKIKLGIESQELKRSTLMRRLVFKSRITELQSSLSEIEKNYNDSIVKDARAFCKADIHCDIEPWSDPNVRKSRAESRKNELKSQKAKLTLNAQIHELDEMIAGEDRLLDDLDKNKSFYDMVYRGLHDQNRKTICRRLRKFIDEQVTAHPEHKELFNELRRHLDKTEKAIADELSLKIREYESKHPIMTAEETAELINIIDQYEPQFVEKSKNFGPFANRRKVLRKEEERQRKYDPFDKAYAKLNRNDLRALADFLGKYKREKYPDRTKQIDALKLREQEITKNIFKTLNEELTKFKDDPTASADKRLKSCNNRIAAIQRAINKFVPGSNEIGKAQEQLAKVNADKAIIEGYKPFETTANMLIGKPSKGKLREIDVFMRNNKKEHYPDTYHQRLFAEIEKQRVNLLNRINAEIKTAENELKDNDKLFAQQRIDRATALKNKYEWAAGEYIQDSDEQRVVLSKKSETERLIADLEKYKAFDEEYSKPKNNLRAVAVFLSTFTVNAYSRPEYVGKIKELEQRKATLINEINEQLETELRKNSDNNSIAASERIKLCQARINALRVAIGKFVIGSKEADTERKELEKQEAFLQTLRGYEEFEKAVSELLGSDENGKLRRIDQFWREHPNVEKRYPDDAYHQQLFLRLKEAEMQLLKSINDVLAEKLNHNKEDLTLSPKKIVARAAGRKAAYEVAKGQYVEGSVPWKNADQGVRVAGAQRDEWKPYIQFEEDYLLAKDAPERERLKRMERFFKDYRDRKLYLKRSEYFSSLEKLKSDTIDALDKRCVSELNKLVKPAMKDFPKWIEYFKQKIGILKKYQAYYPVEYRQYDEINRELKTANEEIDKYKRWRLLRQRAFIIKESWKSKPDAEKLLPDIISFFNDYPLADYTSSEIRDEMEAVSRIRKKAVDEICRRLDEKLNRDKPEDCPNESIRQQVYEAKISTIDKHLDLLVGTDQWRDYKRQRDNFNSKLNKSKREARFKKEYGKLKKDLESAAYSPLEKVNRINSFIARNGDDFKADHRAEFDLLDIARRRFEREDKWSRIEKKILKRPDDNDPSELKRYMDACYELLGETQKYQNYEHLQKRVQTKQDALKIEIEWVKKLVGDGTYADIQEKEKKYKEDPSEENYQTLCNAIEGFDSKKRENHGHEDNVRTIKTNSDKDWKNRQAIVRTWADLEKNKTSENWLEFQTACREFWADNDQKTMVLSREHRSQYDSSLSDDKFDKYRKLHNYLVGGHNVKVTFNEAWRFYNLPCDLSEDNVIVFQYKPTGAQEIDIFRTEFPKGRNYFAASGREKLWYKLKSGDFSATLRIDGQVTVDFKLGIVPEKQWRSSPAQYFQFTVNAPEILIPFANGEKHIKYEKDTRDNGRGGFLIKLEFESL